MKNVNKARQHFSSIDLQKRKAESSQVKEWVELKAKVQGRLPDAPSAFPIRSLSPPWEGVCSQCISHEFPAINDTRILTSTSPGSAFHTRLPGQTGASNVMGRNPLPQQPLPRASGSETPHIVPRCLGTAILPTSPGASGIQATGFQACHTILYTYLPRERRAPGVTSASPASALKLPSLPASTVTSYM